MENFGKAHGCLRKLADWDISDERIRRASLQSSDPHATHEQRRASQFRDVVRGSGTKSGPSTTRRSVSAKTAAKPELRQVRGHSRAGDRLRHGGRRPLSDSRSQATGPRRRALAREPHRHVSRVESGSPRVGSDTRITSIPARRLNCQDACRDRPRPGKELHLGRFPVPRLADPYSRLGGVPPTSPRRRRTVRFAGKHLAP